MEDQISFITQFLCRFGRPKFVYINFPQRPVMFAFYEPSPGVIAGRPLWMVPSKDNFKRTSRIKMSEN